MHALTEALADRPFSEIRVKSLCSTVGISEPTFFKYFPSKEEMLVFFVWLWSIDIQDRIDERGVSGRVAAALLFDETADQMQRSPRVMHEIIAYQMRQESPPALPLPDVADLMTRFVDRPNTWGLSPLPVQDLFRKALESAQNQGQLPREADLDAGCLGLSAIFFGVPASTREPTTIKNRYAASLDLIWRGLSAGSQQRKEEP